MTKLLLVFLMCLTLGVNAGKESLVIKQSYSTTYNQKSIAFKFASSRKRNSESVGPTMMVAGGSFLLLGLLTGKAPVGLNGPGTQSFFQQKGRAAAIISGAVILLSGITVTIIF